MAYYEIIFGSGFYDCYRYVVKTDYPTTDYGALTDVLIDYLKEKGHRNILKREDIEVDDAEDCGDDLEGNDFGYHYYVIDKDDNKYYDDQYVEGGNCGDVLLHYGDFRINEITENEIKNAEIVEV